MSRVRRKNASNTPIPPQPIPPRIERKFISEGAEKRFREKLATKPFVPERGFAVPTPPFREKIERLGWFRLCTHPRPGVVAVVKEFYSNLPDHLNATCFVRGTWVDFSGETINRILSTPQGNSEGFSAFLENPDMQAVIQKLTSCRTEWKKNPRGECVSFPRGALTEEARIWFYFVASTLMPSRHLSSVSRDRAILMYAILEELNFDVGEVIHRAISEAERTRGSWSLSHPHIITALCLRAGVNILENEERVKAVAPLPLRLVRAAGSRAPRLEGRSMDIDGGEDRVHDSDDEQTQPTVGPSERAEASTAPLAPAVDARLMEFLHSMNERQEAFQIEQREHSERLMGFLRTMKEEHEFELKEQREVTDRMDQRLAVLFTNQRKAMKNQRDIWDQQNTLVGKMSELAARQEHLYSIANAAICSLTTTSSEDQATRTVFTPPPVYKEPERRKSPRPYHSPER